MFGSSELLSKVISLMQWRHWTWLTRFQSLCPLVNSLATVGADNLDTVDMDSQRLPNEVLFDNRAGKLQVWCESSASSTRSGSLRQDCGKLTL
ncbi:hypothetical protein [Bradyrhizobium sp. Ash2021]|uniref:hypothetical protein n=1 Tax=Bradyrhizobium sp. Ash2021 TaxID=2954771 RepID=UPI00281652B4|nr:hypothetical protein [Bradyrhizobium sp. Ash2021]WMT79613.1 hypothetical protein NL528_45120 [Bradyrhizobium sp. Ash2021]